MRPHPLIRGSYDQAGRSVAGVVLAILVVVIVVGGVVLYRSPGRRLPGDAALVKVTSQDAATTSKVKTALLL